MEALSIAGGILCDPKEGLGGTLPPHTRRASRMASDFSRGVCSSFTPSTKLNSVLFLLNSDDCMKQCYYTNSLFELQPTRVKSHFARTTEYSRTRNRKYQDVLESQSGGSCCPGVREAAMCKHACSDDNHDRLCRIKDQKAVQTTNEIGVEKSPYKSFWGFYSYFKAR